MAFIKVGNKVLKFGGMVITNDPNPLHLPPLTIRCKFKSGYTPAMGTSQTLVDSDKNIWDIGFESAARLFENNTNLLQVVGANTASVTNMKFMFSGCTALVSVPLFNTASVTEMEYMFFNCPGLTSVPLFNTSSVTDMSYMFYNCAGLTSVPLFNTASVTYMMFMFQNCSGLTSVPLFNTSSVTDMSWMFDKCTNVASGALALYQQASTQANPPSSHNKTFAGCGSSTPTGQAELAQIPSSWGGTAA